MPKRSDSPASSAVPAVTPKGEPLAVVVRPPRLEDAVDLWELGRQPRVMWGTLQMPTTTLEQRRHRLEQSLDDPNRYSYVAEVDGRVVGNVGLEVLRGRRRHIGSIAMAVHDAYQGRGVGTALMAATMDLADNWLGLRRVELQVHVDNEPALALYRHFGFEVEGRQRESVFRQGVYCDTYIMGRLRPGT